MEFEELAATLKKGYKSFDRKAYLASRKSVLLEGHGELKVRGARIVFSCERESIDGLVVVGTEKINLGYDPSERNTLSSNVAEKYGLDLILERDYEDPRHKMIYFVFNGWQGIDLDSIRKSVRTVLRAQIEAKSLEAKFIDKVHLDAKQDLVIHPDLLEFIKNFRKRLARNYTNTEIYDALCLRNRGLSFRSISQKTGVPEDVLSSAHSQAKRVYNFSKV